MATPLTLGAPGIYPVQAPPVRRLAGVRMDVAAFVGIAPRGPGRVPDLEADWVEDRWEGVRKAARTVPVAVESWEEYARLYGAFEGVGLLPYAAASFFEQGGRRAYIARIVPGEEDGADTTAVSWGCLPGLRAAEGGDPVVVRARSEGSWGNRLAAQARLDAFRLTPRSASGPTLILEPTAPVTVGTLLRATPAGGPAELHYVADISEEWSPQEGRIVRATLDGALTDTTAKLEVLEARLVLAETGEHPAGAWSLDRTELHTRLGLSWEHPRWLGKVLALESELVRPDPSWMDASLAPDGELVAGKTLTGDVFQGGSDRYAAVTPEDFFDDDWDPLGDQRGSGIHCLSELEDLSVLVVPDLYSPKPLASVEEVGDPGVTSGAEFAPCRPTARSVTQAEPDGDLTGLRLVPPGDLDAIIELQSRVVAFADQRGDVHALLDVPPGLHKDDIVRWRSHFSSVQAAAYHPWLRAGRVDDARGALIDIPPSGVAAGILAWHEEHSGVQHGPANVLARGIVDVAIQVVREEHDELHPLGINVFLLERDGVRLTAARSLGHRPEYRQISVRRLMTLLARTLEQRMQWTVFEPNGERLRREVRRMVMGFLRELYRAGAFRGASEDEAFFVRCDETLNTPGVIDAGQLLCEVGVAPAEPLEFITLLLVRRADGTVLMEG